MHNFIQLCWRAAARGGSFVAYKEEEEEMVKEKERNFERRTLLSVEVCKREYIL